MSGARGKNKRKGVSYPLTQKIKILEELSSGLVSQSKLCRKYRIRGHSTLLKWKRQHNKLLEQLSEMEEKPNITEGGKTELSRLRKHIEVLEFVVDAFRQSVKEEYGGAALKKLHTQYLEKLKEVKRK